MMLNRKKNDLILQDLKEKRNKKTRKNLLLNNGKIHFFYKLYGFV